MNRAVTLACAAGLLCVAAIGCVANGPDAIDEVWDAEQALADLEATQPGSAHRDAVARRVCSEIPGPKREARWTPDDMLVCALQDRTPSPSL